MRAATRRQALCALVCAGVAPAWAQSSRESLVKASFLHRFASFVEWPASSFDGPRSPLRIGVLGDDEVWRDLRDLAADRGRDGRPVRVVRLHAGDPVQNLHILYVRASTAARAEDVLSLVPAGVLTVTDVGGVHPRNSVISFFVEDQQVRFGASTEAARRQGLRLSPRLLSIARGVRTSDPRRAAQSHA